MGNVVTVIGNVTRDPELRYTPNGSSVASFGVAWNRRYERNGEQIEDVSYFDITCWASLADNVAASITKGTRVVVTGRLDQRSWEGQNGEKRSKVEITADDVAPSLRWASAEIRRNERTDNFGGGGGGNYGGGAPQGGTPQGGAPQGGAPQGGQQSGAPEGGPQPQYNYDEEPF